MCVMTNDANDAPATTPGRRPVARIALLLLPAVVFMTIFWIYLVKQANKPEPGARAPDFTASYLNEPGTFTLSSLRGKPVLLNFWASWCEPCKDETPLLQEAYERYNGRVEFVGIDTRDSRTDALKFVDELGVTYPQTIDEGERLYTQYGLTGQPESFFIDQDGVVVKHIPGALVENDLYQYLDVLVNRDA